MADWSQHARPWLRASLEDSVAQGDELIVEVGSVPIAVSCDVARGTDNRLVPEELRIVARVLIQPSSITAGAYREAQRLTMDSCPLITLRPRTRSDDLGISLGLNGAILSGDEAFDLALWVASDSPPSVVKDLVAIGEVRAAALALIRLRAERIRLNDAGSPLLVKAWIHTEDPDARTRIAALLSHTSALSRALPLFSGKPTGRRIVPLLMEYAFLPLPLLGIVSSMASYEWRAPMDVWPIPMLLGMAFVLWLISAAAAYLVARGRHNGFLLFKSTAIPLLIGLPGLAVATGIVVNGAWDQQWTPYQTEVVSIRKGDPTEVLVREVRPGLSGTITLDEDRVRCRTVEPSTRLVLTLSEGRLGWPWVVDAACE